MSTQSRTVRVFLSSTFRDFAEERDLLVRKVFPELRRKCRERQVELVDVDLRWGITEEEAQQGKVLPICLTEIDRSRPYFMGFIGDRYGWVPEKDQYDLSLLLEQSWLDEHRGGKSVTELEMLHGVLNNPAMEDRAFFYFRDSAYSQAKGGAYLSEGPQEKAKLEALKDRIRQSGFPVVENYRTPDELAERVRDDLWELIDEAFPESEVPDALTRERMRHEAYSATRRRLYLDGEKYFQFLDAAMKRKDFKPVLVTGQSGGGKSALLANWVSAWIKQHPKTSLILHHLGCGADAADPVRMATRLMQEISRATGEEVKPESDPDKLLEKLPECLAQASAWAVREKQELLIVLDGLDKLNGREHLRWFPAHLPPKVKLVASCLDGEILQAAKGRLDWSELRVKPFTRAEQTRFIKEYLGRYRKSLTTLQAKTLQTHPLSGNPLFLLTVLEELRVFGIHEKLEKRLQVLLSPPSSKGNDEEPTVDDVFEHVLARIEEDLGKKSVQIALEAIWASRSGLFQDEILAIANSAPAEWAAIQNSLDESLYDSNGKINFGHDYLRKAAEDRYKLTGKKKLKLHRKLAEWFDDRACNAGVDERLAEELPWQWKMANDKENLVKCILKCEIFKQCYIRDKFELLNYWLWSGKNISAEYEGVWKQWMQDSNDEEVAKFASRLGLFLQFAGLYGDFIVVLLRLALETSEKIHGALHPFTLGNLTNLGNLLIDKGDYDSAEALYCRALLGREKVLGIDHCDTLHSVNNLGILLSIKGDYNNAEALYRRALLGREKALGSYHPDTLSSINNLGVLLSKKGDYDGAEALYRSALLSNEKALGTEHPETLSGLNNLGAHLTLKGNFTEAEILLSQALLGQEKVLGNKHPVTIGTVHNLGNLFFLQGKNQGAEAFYRRALEGREKSLGIEHPDTLSTLNSLGNVLLDIGNPDSAETIFRSALHMRKKVLGPKHPDTLGSINSLSICLSNKGDINGAENLCRQALSGYEKVYGIEHPNTLATINNLASLLKVKGDYKGAETQYRRALKGKEKTLGNEHPDTLNSANNLGGVLKMKGDYEGAEALYRKILAGREKVLGLEHHDTIKSVVTLSVLMRKRGNLDESIYLLRKWHCESNQWSEPILYQLAASECLNGNILESKKLITIYLKKFPNLKKKVLESKLFMTLHDFIKTL